MTPPLSTRPLLAIDLDRRPVAVFDFDGTLTRSDTLIPFLRLAAGSQRFVLGLVAAAVAWRHRDEAGRDHAKRRLLERALRGLPDAELRAAGERYATSLLADAMRPEMVERLIAHRDRGDRVVIVSASLAYYLEPLADELGVTDLLCCRMGLQSAGRCSGELLGVNPRGHAKVELVRNLLGPGAIVDHAYGNDVAADGPMLAMARSSMLVGTDDLTPLPSNARSVSADSSAPIQQPTPRMQP